MNVPQLTINLTGSNGFTAKIRVPLTQELSDRIDKLRRAVVETGAINAAMKIPDFTVEAHTGWIEIPRMNVLIYPTGYVRFVLYNLREMTTRGSTQSTDWNEIKKALVT